MDWGDIIIRWTARIAVAAYLGRLLIDRSHGSARLSRGVWTGGLIVFLAHVAAAFHFQHHWDHTAAFEHTRQRTLALTGWDSGVGLYLNELMAVWWLIDTVLWWRDHNWPARRLPQLALHAFFAFMTVNATVVFGPPGWWAVLTAFVIVWLVIPHRGGRSAAE